jgi:hypothetical protein
MGISGLESRFASTPGYADLVRRFKRSLADDLDFLRYEASGGDVAKRVHRIKGAAYMLGFDLLGDLAANSERHEDQLPCLLLALELLASDTAHTKVESEAVHRAARRESPESRL